MNFIDIILLIPLIYGLIQGIRHGFVKEVCSLLAIIVGIYIARYFSLPVITLLISATGWSKDVCTVLTYVLLFIGVVLCVNLLAWAISKLLNLIMLGWVDKLFGAVFGLLKLVLIVSVILNCLALVNNFIPIKKTEAIRQSKMYEPIENVMESVMPFLNYESFKKAINKL